MILTQDDLTEIGRVVRMEIEKFVESAFETGLLKHGALSGTERSRRSRASKHNGDATKNVAKVDTGETWKSYMDAYFHKYGTEAVRNATVNSQMMNFVKRVGVKESPNIAAFYLTHRDSRYVRDRHSVGLLAYHAEPLRMEWAMNHQMTGTAAMQVDRQAATGDAVESAIRIMRERDAKRAANK